MFSVEIDESRNLIKLSLESEFNEEEARQCLEEFKICVPRLKTGFKILTNLSNVQNITPSAAPHIEQIMDLCNESGVSRIARVIPNPNKDIGFNIMSAFHYSDNVHIITCPTMAEALHGLFIDQECV